jgi:uncharacterized membrane protein YeiH
MVIIGEMKGTGMNTTAIIMDMEAVITRRGGGVDRDSDEDQETLKTSYKLYVKTVPATVCLLLYY